MNGKQFLEMLARLPARVWLLAILGLATAAFTVPIEQHASGKFVLRPVVRAESPLGFSSRGQRQRSTTRP